MKTIHLIGIGPGDPRHLTVQAIDTLRMIDVFFLLEKEGRGKDELLDVRRTIIARYAVPGRYRIVIAPSPPRQTDAAGYLETIRAWHARKRALFAELFARELRAGEHGAFLLWGEPTLYDQTLTLIADLAAATPTALSYEIVPGISAVQVLAARHRVPLNRVNEELVILPGRQLANRAPATLTNAVVMLDGAAQFQHLRGHGLTLYWGADLGGPDEALVAGPLDAVCDDALRLRAELRAAKGWVMDTYLLRRPRDER